MRCLKSAVDRLFRRTFPAVLVMRFGVIRLALASASWAPDVSYPFTVAKWKSDSIASTERQR